MTLDAVYVSRAQIRAAHDSRREDGIGIGKQQISARRRDTGLQFVSTDGVVDGSRDLYLGVDIALLAMQGQGFPVKDKLSIRYHPLSLDMKFCRPFQDSCCKAAELQLLAIPGDNLKIDISIHTERLRLPKIGRHRLEDTFGIRIDTFRTRHQTCLKGNKQGNPYC